MAINSVDEFIKAKIRPEQRDIVELLRKLMRQVAPNAKETIGYGIPLWKGNKPLAVISPSKTHITFSFTHGAEFEDKYGLLEGVGKVSRHVKIKKLSDVNEAALRDYILQALEVDKK